MSFDAPKLMLVGLAEIILPSATLRLCDGGFVYKDGQKFASSDPVFGAIESVDFADEKVGDEAPAGQITFLPNGAAEPGALSDPGFQGSPIKFWLARVDEATGEISGTPELVFDGELDTTVLRISRGTRALDMGFICIAERLFQVNEGNCLSSRQHESVWTGEDGFDNATGVGGPVAWGTESPRSATSKGSFRLFGKDMQVR